MAPIPEVDVRVLHGCLVSLLYKFSDRWQYRFEPGRIVAKISAEKAMQLVDLRPLSETVRVRSLLWLREQLFWELDNAQPSPCLPALVGDFECEHEPPITAEGGLGTSAPTHLRPHSADLAASGLRHFLPGWHRWVMEASRADFEYS